VVVVVVVAVVVGAVVVIVEGIEFVILVFWVRAASPIGAQ
jgi:hypothetical protein